MAEEYLILVDENDNPIGTEEKVKCHLPNGKLHRAFTALLFDNDGKLVLTRRSPSKMLWPDVGSENEICGTLLGIVEPSSQFNLVEDEISEVKWITADELLTELKNNPQIYCPWMLIALFLLPSSDKKMLEKHSSIINQWMKPELKKQLEESIKYHLPTNNWRLVN